MYILCSPKGYLMKLLELLERSYAVRSAYDVRSYAGRYIFKLIPLFNPRRACAARVTVLGPSVCSCLSVCLSVSVSTNILALQATKGHQSDTNSPSATSDPKLNKKAILLKRRRSRSRNWHYSGPRCVTQPIN